MLIQMRSVGYRLRSSQKMCGLSMIEMTVAMAIMSLAMFAVLPSISNYFQAATLRTAAQSYFSGAQAARAEAIRRNAPVEFVLAAAPVSAANVGSVASNTSAQNWAVRRAPVAPETAYELLESKSVDEGRSSMVVVASSAASVTFNGLGMANTAMTIGFSNPSGGECAPTGPMRCLQLMVSAGGQVRLCDPAASDSDSRRC